MTTPKQSFSQRQWGLGIAEAFVLLSAKWPKKSHALIAWSDADVALAGAVLMDLAFAGKVDSDQDNLIILEQSLDTRDSPDAQSVSLRMLGKLGESVRLDIAIEELVSRIGDLRSATISLLASRKINITTCSSISGDFHQVVWNGSRVRQAVALRKTLRTLVESEELPHPEHAALISLLYACEILGPVLGGRSKNAWSKNHQVRLEAIRRLDLVGHAVAETVSRLRRRLGTYLLDAGPNEPASSEKRKVQLPLVGYTRSKVTWEWRVFWPEGDVVTLPPSWEGFGVQADSEEEILEDDYLFVYGKKDNIKIRGSGLKIKRVVEACDDFIAFDASVKFRFPEKTAQLSKIFPRLYEVKAELNSGADFIEVMSATGYQPRVLMVSKARRVQSMVFGVQIEFSRVCVQGSTFNSISLESPYLTALRILARNVPVGSGKVAGYSGFLERIAGRE
jgi:hypothetical protein